MIDSTAPDRPSEVEEVPSGPSEAEIRALRDELGSVSGPAYWEALERLSSSAPFQSFLKRWFPSQAPRFGPELERRDFLRMMSASLAVAGLGACTRQPEEKIAPFGSAPEYIVPGRPRYFATAFPTGDDVIGILVESHMNRPTKVEGNPDHPASLGATNGQAQAAILGLYDPDRSHSIQRAGQPATWDGFVTELEARLDGVQATGGEGIAVLVGDCVSPTLEAQVETLAKRYPQMGIHHWTPLHRDNSRQAARRVFDRDVETRFDLGRARTIVSLDADFLATGRGGVRYARDFARARRAREGSESFNRLYAIESSVTVTGAMADHRLALPPSGVEAFARVLASELGVASGEPRVDERTRKFARAVARDLSANAGAGLVVAGEWQSAAVHVLAHLINDALKNVGNTVEYTEPLHGAGPWQEGSVDSIVRLVTSIRRGEVSTLILIGGNPVYDAPTDLDFATALRRVPFRAHLSPHVDETSTLCNWHVPMTHFLESWSDARAYDGTVSIVQPLIAPLYAGRSPHELLAVLGRSEDEGSGETDAYSRVRAHWKAELGLDGEEFEKAWQTALHNGLIEGTRREPIDVSPPAELEPGEFVAASGLEITLRPDPSAHDGRFANNGWLQETPRPLTRLTWENAALISKRTADALGVDSGDVIELAASDRRVEAPVWVTPGHPDDAVTLHVGYGRTSAGQLGTGVGFDAYRLRTSYGSWRIDGVTAERTGRSVELASVQDHASMEGRDLVKVTTFDRFSADPHEVAARHGAHDPNELSMYESYSYDGYAWGMVIDLNACIGCNACMVACQSENNIPVVGKAEVAKGRELHWIRIDRYYEEGEDGQTSALHQPIPCMHCENAPCEVVCPVGATVHGDEGLNEMVYNRCVGTRYCANNCPYKVRRFNFHLYADFETESLKLANNPDVTVRSRGVMEKCTYCVQRINQVRITAKREDRVIRDGEAVSACMQACPTEAIVFGDVNDETSEVSKQRTEPHHYALLEELGTRPRTTYLAKLRNPNPDLETS